ncbi:hypothetical protein [Bacillus sp. 03113]|uniref:hypothetical protein n=1 Tax=Bacillus sp. 03113 TaxID=2578211 RepID=UPI00114289B0|nr:hypothetical protein [Bacillus sp. 03113]
MNLENLIADFKKTGSDTIFEKVYREIEKETRFNQQQYIETVAESINATEHETRELFDDCIIYTIKNYNESKRFIPYFKWKFRNMRANFMRDKQTVDSIEIYASQMNETAMHHFEIVDEFNLERHITKKKKADQMQLIDFFLNGADTTTTAIVETFLAHPKPTATAIAKEIGCHHSKVIRALNRLAAKYDTKQFGDYHDYLVAQ